MNIHKNKCLSVIWKRKFISECQYVIMYKTLRYEAAEEQSSLEHHQSCREAKVKELVFVAGSFLSYVKCIVFDRPIWKQRCDQTSCPVWIWARYLHQNIKEHYVASAIVSQQCNWTQIRSHKHNYIPLRGSMLLTSRGKWHKSDNHAQYAKHELI